MSDVTTIECNSNSKSNLIEHQHVGVTAKLQSPLKSLMLSYSSSTESENTGMLYRGNQYSNAKYNKFLNDGANETDTTVTEHSKILYEMKTMANKKSNLKLTPSKIEFHLYSKPKKRLQRNKASCDKRAKKLKRQLFVAENKTKIGKTEVKPKTNIFQRLKISLNKMKDTKQQQLPKQKQEQQHAEDKIFADFPEPIASEQEKDEIHIGIYPFEYGCAEYLKTHDCPPQIISMILAERATHYATRFWAEFFGSLQIGVAFLVTFLLQTYRFVLYSLVNILLVEFLHMTSDYFVKPVLTVLFNGYLQPPLIFCFNILSSIRDISQPITDTINNFMKPLATVGRSLRLVHATYNKKSIAKTV